jgi:hypothetical protein
VFGVFDLVLQVMPVWFGRPEPIPHQPQINTLLGLHELTISLLGCLNNGLQNGLIFTLQFALVRDVLLRLARRLGPKAAADVSTAIAIVLVTLIVTTVSTIETALTLLVLLRIGLLATTVMFVITAVIQRMPLALDSTKFYANEGWFAVAIVFGLGVLGFWTARQQAQAPGRIAVRA